MLLFQLFQYIQSYYTNITRECLLLALAESLGLNV